MNEKLIDWFENEIAVAEKEIERAKESMVNVILNCGKNDIAVDEYIKTIKYYRNRIVEIKGFICNL